MTDKQWRILSRYVNDPSIHVESFVFSVSSGVLEIKYTDEGFNKFHRRFKINGTFEEMEI